MKEKINCQFCGVEFTPANSLAKYCSKECQTKARSQRRVYKTFCDYCGKELNRKRKTELSFCDHNCAKKYRQEHNEKRKCIVCGKEFVPTKSNQLCCSRKCRDKNSKYKRGSYCIECGKFFQAKSNTKFCSKECRHNHKMRNYRQTKICKECGQEFEGFSFQKFCSDSCKQKFGRKQNVVWVTCDFCGKEYPKTIYEIKQGATNFCSHGCCIGYLYKNGIITNKQSGPHLKINGLLETMGINYINEYSVDRFSLDIYLPDFCLAIEIMGDYWHGNSEKYIFENLEERQTRCIEKDKRKQKIIEDEGIKILYLWQKDIEKDILKCQFLIENFIEDNLILYHSTYYEIKDGELKEKENYKKQFMDL